MVYTLEIRSRRKSFILWTGVISLLLGVLLSLLPSMESEGMKVVTETSLESIPDALLAAIGIEYMPDFSNPSIYYAYIIQYINIAVAAFSCQIGAISLIEEEDEGTIEYLYAQPITRKTIIIEKILANISGIVVLNFVINIVGVAFMILFKSNAYGTSEVLVNIIRMGLGTFSLSIIYFILGTSASVMMNRNSNINGIAMGIVLGSYIFGILGETVEKLEILRKISPMGIVNPMRIEGREFPLAEMLVWGAISLALLFISIIHYDRKDLQ